MKRLPSAVEQLLQMHAPFLHAVVSAVRTPALAADLQAMLTEAEARGWGRMAAAVRQILAGRRDRALLDGLDDAGGYALEYVGEWDLPVRPVLAWAVSTYLRRT